MYEEESRRETPEEEELKSTLYFGHTLNISLFLKNEKKKNFLNKLKIFKWAKRKNREMKKNC